ncbi:ribonuclease H-like domain-containing protein [Tanacetum coccineum]
MDQDSSHMMAASKVPMLKPGEVGLRVKSITTAKEKAQRRLEVKAKSTLMIGIPNEHQLKFNSIKDAKKLLESVEKRFGGNASTRKTQRNLLKDQYENFTALSSEMPDQILTGFKSLRFLKNTRRKLTVNGNETIGFDKSKVECYNCHKRGHFARECRSPRNQDNKNKKSSRRNMPVETSTSTALVLCDGLGGYYLSDQAEEGPNYALMAFSSSSSVSEVSNESICSKSCLKTIESLKSQNDQLIKDLKKSELVVIGYKTGLKSVEEKLEVYKANESIYSQDIKGLKFEIHIGEITVRELRKKLERNFMPPTPDLSFTGLDEFVNKPVVENCKAMSSEEEPKVVRKYDDALSIEEWVSDDEEEDVSQPKTEKKTVRPSIVKKKFVKINNRKNCLGKKLLNQVENIGGRVSIVHLKQGFRGEAPHVLS